MNGARTNSNRHGASGAVAAGAEVALDEPLLDCEAAAVLLNVRVSWVRDAARQGHLPCLRVGRHLRFTRAILDDGDDVLGGAGPVDPDRQRLAGVLVDDVAKLEPALV
jgi:excisionase family DNA binding protein